MLVSERIGQFFVESESGRDRLEFTEYGAGDQWVVLVHGLLLPRRMHQPVARAMADRRRACPVATTEIDRALPMSRSLLRNGVATKRSSTP